jgi:hypothetical protein
MSERATIHQSVQVGVEVDAGTQAAASRRLAGVAVQMNPKAEVTTFRAGGSKYASTTAKAKEWSEGSISGVPTYTELALLLAANYGNASVVDNEDGTYTWNFSAESHGPDNVKSLTIEQGSSVRAHRALGCVVSDLTLAFSRAAGTQEVSGAILGQAIADGVTMTAAATEYPLEPITAEHVTVYLDNTEAALGTTALDRAFSIELAHTGRFSPVWVLKQSQASYATTVEGAPELKATLTVAADSQGMGLLSQLRAGQTKWLRIEAVNGTNRLTIDLPVRVAAVQDFSDEGGVFAFGAELVAIHDDAFGGSHKVELRNTISAL